MRPAIIREWEMVVMFIVAKDLLRWDGVEGEGDGEGKRIDMSTMQWERLWIEAVVIVFAAEGRMVMCMFFWEERSRLLAFVKEGRLMPGEVVVRRVVL